MVISLFTFFCSLFWPFVVCHIAKFTIDRISNIRYTVYASNWYELPAKHRKYLVLIIVRSQVLIRLTGFNLIDCDLKTFGKVSNFWNEFFWFVVNVSHFVFISNVMCFSNRSNNFILFLSYWKAVAHTTSSSEASINIYEANARCTLKTFLG